VQKTFNTLRYSFLKIIKYINYSSFGLNTIYKNLNIQKLNFIKFNKYFYFRKNNISNFKKTSFIKSKFLLFHLPAAIFFFAFLYITIPTFYNYDKSDIEKKICKDKNIKCVIEKDIKYKFYPTPRLKINGFTINELGKNKTNLISADDASIKLSFKNLLVKDKHKFTKIKIDNFEANLNSKNFNKYKNIIDTKIDLAPIILKNGKVIIHDGKNYVASIYNASIKGNFLNNSNDIEINGKFLSDDISIILKSSNIDKEPSADLIIKMRKLNFLSKINFSLIKSKKTTGNFLIKKNKNKIAGIFRYENDELIINKSNLRNSFIEGKLEGKITLIPFFDFNIELNLNSINFTKLYNHFLSLDKNQQKKLFKINRKINGNLTLSADKIYSKHNLIKSFESRLKFYNGNLNIEQFLINLGKLGAADVIGKINNDKKFTNLKFESNIFVDNKKKFISKFGIYDVKKLFSNAFVSGNFDLDNAKLSIYEISDDKKLNINDVNYIESEFNDIMLENDFLNLFNFVKFKFFLKSIISEINLY